MALDQERESISLRLSKLNQVFQGRNTSSEALSLVGREGLLDALFVLYDECSSDYLMKNQYISSFVNKYTPTIKELKKLRIGIKDFDLKDVIGRGHFGEVKVVKEKHSGDVYALKILRKSDTLAQQNVAFYEEERDIMCKTNSSWITQLQYAFQDPQYLYLVMEFHPGGDLLSLLSRYDDQFEEKMAKFYLSEMVLAIHSLHTMGYVHRDVKPENILIDRTGHVKLADFGSACKLNNKHASVSNMPVGTPDYICPEVLAKMNGNVETGKFGAECDWWSLGICAYEMLYGKTPFTDEKGSMVVTYSNIMNHKKCLKFADDVDVSKDAKGLIEGLLTDADSRITYDRLRVHPFFADINFDTMRAVRPPFIPTITSCDDTSNFEEFDKKTPAPTLDLGTKGKEFSGKQLPFVGFTFTKEMLNDRGPSLTMEVSSPACKASVERRLASKSKDLQELREKYNKKSDEEVRLASENKGLKMKYSEAKDTLTKVEAERDVLERDIACYITEINSLKRMLELEKQERVSSDSKAMALLDDITTQNSLAQKLREDANIEQITELNEIIEQLEEEKHSSIQKAESLQKSVARYQQTLSESETKINDLKEQLAKWKDNSKQCSKELTVELASKQRDLDVMKQQLHVKLEKAQSEANEACLALREVRQSKNQLEQELFDIQMENSATSKLQKKLRQVEEEKQELQERIHRLEIYEMREGKLKEEINEKTEQLAHLKQKIMSLEESMESRELEYKKCEKLYKQREDQLLQRLDELESNLDQTRCSKTQLEDDSIMVFEKNEEHLLKIDQQHIVINELRGNISLLSEQNNDLKKELETYSLQLMSPNKKSRHKRSAVCQTESPLLKQSRQKRLENCQTESPLKTRNISAATEMETSEDCLENSTYGMENSTRETPKKFVSSSSGNSDVGDLSPMITTRRSSTRHSQSSRQSPRKCLQSEGNDSVFSSSASPVKRDRRQVDGETRVSFTLHVSRRSEQGQGDGESGEEGVGEPDVRIEHVSDYQEKENMSPGVKRANMELVNELKQDKLALESKVQSLQSEIASIQDSTHQQRIRALDLKHELREERIKTTTYETELSELKIELSKAQLESSEAAATISNYKEKESSTRAKMKQVSEEVDKLTLESHRKIKRLQEERDDLETELKPLRCKIARLEKDEKSYRSNIEHVESELKTVTSKYTQLVPKHRDAEEQLKCVLEDKNRFKMQAERAKDELGQKNRDVELLEQKIIQLKALCGEMEKQVEDFEKIVIKYETKQSALMQERINLEKSVDDLERVVFKLERQLTQERNTREKADSKVEELNQGLASSRETYTTEMERLKQSVGEKRVRIDMLNHQLTQMEHERSQVDVDNKNLNRRADVLYEDTIKLKEELSNNITKNSELRNSNLKLGKNLEEAMDRYDELATQNTDLENHIENLQMNYEHEKYKMEATINQQGKLIDYLQAKVENPPKKKKGIFGQKKPETGCSTLQYREVQYTLEHERDKNSVLRQQILKMKDELNMLKAESFRLKQNSRSDTSLNSTTGTMKGAFATPTSHPTISALVMSPNTLPQASTPIVPKPERMHHKIPHRFVTGLNSRATKCAVCLGSVHFVQMAAKCQECQTVCHPRCSSSLPHTCGLPTEYAQHFADTLGRAKKLSRTKLSVANLKLHTEAWMKIPRSGKQVWERKWVVLKNNSISVYNSQHRDQEPVDVFELCPNNGEVTVQSAVTAAELTNTAATDLPYILRCDFEPDTTCWPGRSLYLMAASFPDKQKWVAMLEAIVNHSGKEDRLKDSKLLGRSILKVTDSRIEFNSSVPVNKKTIFVGADEGLYALEATQTSQAKLSTLVKIEGLNSVHDMCNIEELGLLAIITGRDRRLVTIDTETVLGTFKDGKGYAKPDVIEGGTAVTTFAYANVSDGVYLCAASSDKILLLKYIPTKDAFITKKKIDIEQPCSCMYFGNNRVIIGSDKFYKFDIYTYEMAEFLDREDRSLAFAAFGAASYHSFPMAVLRVNPPGAAEELLLCFHEFGVFVNGSGRRTREDDMRWSGLPLHFAFEQPYLYVIHFSSMQVIEILPTLDDEICGRKTFMNMSHPRFLGKALTEGAMYVAELHDTGSEIMCFKGNTPLERHQEEVHEVKVYTPIGKSASQRSQIRPAKSHESGFVSPSESSSAGSPPSIRRMSRSPGSSRKRPSPSSDSMSSNASSVTVVKLRAAMLDQKRKRILQDDESTDSSL